MLNKPEFKCGRGVCTVYHEHVLLSSVQERCVDSCAGKLIRSNHRLMGTYVQLMPRMVQRRMEEMESKAAENAKATEAAALLSATEAPSLSQSPVTSSPLPPLPLSVADVGPDAQGSSSKLTGSDVPVELSAASEGKLWNHAGSGPQPVAGPQIEFEGPVPAFVPSQPTSISTVASPPVSKSAESLSHRERATEIPPASGQ